MDLFELTRALVDGWREPRHSDQRVRAVVHGSQPMVTDVLQPRSGECRDIPDADQPNPAR